MLRKKTRTSTIIPNSKLILFEYLKTLVCPSPYTSDKLARRRKEGQIDIRGPVPRESLKRSMASSTFSSVNDFVFIFGFDFGGISGWAGVEEMTADGSATVSTMRDRFAFELLSPLAAKPLPRSVCFGSALDRTELLPDSSLHSSWCRLRFFDFFFLDDAAVEGATGSSTAFTFSFAFELVFTDFPAKMSSISEAGIVGE